MPEGRPAIPVPTRRQVLIESRHRCAICQHPDVELHHIVPWHRCREHNAENLIALCPNCHTRVERGEIDAIALRTYKAQQPLPHSSFAGLSKTFLHRASELAQPPQPYIAHPYVLLESHEFIGRHEELRDLDCWFSDDASGLNPKRLYVVTGIGGLGKSAVTWRWFNSVVAKPHNSLSGAIWWSFYESDATFDNFVIRTLAYVAQEPIGEISRLKPMDQDERLIRVLNQERFLIVLDGFERLLMAYRDDELSATCNLHQSRRDTYSLRISSFLRKLSPTMRSRVLLTSRLFPSTLEQFNGEPITGVTRRDLRGLTTEDALALWRSFEISGSEQRLAEILSTIDNHPLVIRALASQVCRFRQSPGDFSAWLANHPQFTPTELADARAAMQHILAFALRDLALHQQEVLKPVTKLRLAS